MSYEWVIPVYVAVFGLLMYYFGMYMERRSKNDICKCDCHVQLGLKGECGICYRCNCGWRKRHEVKA